MDPYGMISTMDSLPSIGNTSLTNFSFSLFKELGNSHEGNLFASTYSIHLLLLLLSIGARAKTNDDLLSVLHISKGEKKKTRRSDDIIDDSRYLKIANGIFVDNAFEISEDFEKKAARNYLPSEVKNVNFAGDPTSAENKINRWTRNQTKGKITKLFDSGTIGSDTVLVLASAVHFKNEWEKEFTESKRENFCLSAEDRIKVDMMHQTNHFPYYKDEDNKFAAVELPYNGENFQMLVVLPDQMDGITDLEKTFLSDSTHFYELVEKMKIHQVVLTLPKFTFESDLNLKTAMVNLGCGDMFTPKADFSGLSSSGAGNLKVSDIKHKSLVDVNEQGTEAAAVTGSAIVNYMLKIQPKNAKTVNFKACHPFLFFIKNDDKIIFMGRLTNPKANI